MWWQDKPSTQELSESKGTLRRQELGRSGGKGVEARACPKAVLGPLSGL